MADGPVPERLEPDHPDADFSGARPAEEASLLAKYPQANSILAENPRLSGKKLAAQLKVRVETGYHIKKEWQARQPAQAKGSEKEGFKLPHFPKGNVLGEKEAREIGDSLTSALESDFQALDTWLWGRQMAVGLDTNQQPVWSDLDTEQVEKLTRVLLRWGQSNATTATVVRGIVDSSDYIAVGTIFAPRIKQTVEIYRQTRKPRAKRGQVPHEHSN